jgi:hypothetical protein
MNNKKYFRSVRLNYIEIYPLKKVTFKKLLKKNENNSYFLIFIFFATFLFIVEYHFKLILDVSNHIIICFQKLNIWQVCFKKLGDIKSFRK